MFVLCKVEIFNQLTDAAYPAGLVRGVRMVNKVIVDLKCYLYPDMGPYASRNNRHSSVNNRDAKDTVR